MQNSISFKASFIKKSTIAYCNHDKGLSDINASFVQLDPYNKNDMETMNEICEIWGHNPRTFAKNIYEKMNPKTHNQKNRITYALTLQQDNYSKLNPIQVLGLTQIRIIDEKKINIDVLQVDPGNKWQAQERSYKKIGTGILDTIKQLYPASDIYLRSVTWALDFYKKNGFENYYKTYCVLKR